MKLKWLSEDIAEENGALDLVAISKKTRVDYKPLDDDNERLITLPSVQRPDEFVGKYSFSQALEFAEGENQNELATIVDTKMQQKSQHKQSLQQVKADDKPEKAVSMNHSEPLENEDDSGEMSGLYHAPQAEDQSFRKPMNIEGMK